MAYIVASLPAPQFTRTVSVATGGLDASGPLVVRSVVVVDAAPEHIPVVLPDRPTTGQVWPRRSA